MCLANTVEPASKLRRDGRALRFEATKVTVPVLTEFARWAQVLVEDLSDYRRASTVKVSLGDGRRPREVVGSLAADLALFSPPYLNNIDYTEIYKLEAWLCGFLSTQAEFREQRRLTLRSHPSVRFGSGMEGRRLLGPRFHDLVEPVVQAVPDTVDQAWRRRLISEYFDDIALTLQGHREVLRPGGKLVCVIGNSVHGTGEARIVIAADLVVAGLARALGYTVKSLQVARIPKRTTASIPFVRESVLTLISP
jgi:hypothetical protein